MPTAAACRPDPDPPMDTPDRPVRVLCVDDNSDAAESLALMLRLTGFDARASSDSTAAVVEAADFRPDACVLDIGMPGLNGFELARWLRAEFGPGLRLIAVTGVPGVASDQRVAEVGIDRVFAKPADPDALRAALARPAAVAPNGTAP
jgi:DNA-binding response OmpR family regulator